MVGEDVTFSSSTATSLSGYSTNALRFGLVDIKPVEVIETIKRFGIKFKQITRRFESLKPSESFEDFITFQNEAIFNSVEIPQWFESEKLVEIFSKSSIDQYANDQELKQIIDGMKKTTRRGKPFLSFIQFMMERFESRRTNYLELEARNFLNSNLPLSFYNKIVVFDNTYYELLRILENIIRRYEVMASTARSTQLSFRHIERMKKAVGPIIDQLDGVLFSLLRLKKFVIIWNSKDYKEIFDHPFLDINKIDSSGFEKVNKDYNTKLSEIRAFLLNYDPNVFYKTLDSDPTTARMFGQLFSYPPSALTF